MSVERPRWLIIHPFLLRISRGIEAYVWSLAQALQRSGVQVDLLTWQGPLQPPAWLAGSGIRLLRAPAVRYYQAACSVPFNLACLARRRYDHIFVYFAGHGVGASLSLFRLLRPTPFTVVYHFPPALVPHRYREFERWSYPQRASRQVAVSRYLARQVEAWSGRPCAAIGHGVDTQRFKPDAERRRLTRIELGLTSHDFLIVSTAALEERKGMQFVVQALPQVLAVHPETRYLVLGDGAYRPELTRLVADLGLQAQVMLPGSTQQVEDYLAAADLFAALSSGEAASVSLLEAMACSLPAITSRREPFDELMQPAWGEMLNEQNIPALADAICGFIEHPELRQSMGAAGRDWAVQRCTWEQVARQYRELIG